MFNNLKMHFLNSNDAMVYNDIVVGLFNNYRITSNSGVHLQEDRKLNEDEMDQFLEKIDSSDIEEETWIAPEELQDMLSKIVKYHPETKYIVQGFHEVLAVPRRIEKKKKKLAEEKAAKEKKKELQRKSRELKPEPEKQKKEIKPIDVDYGNKEETPVEKETVEQKPQSKKQIKPIDVDYGKQKTTEKNERKIKENEEKEREEQEKVNREKMAEEKRLEEERRFKKDREEKEKWKNKKDEELDEEPTVEKKDSKFGGFLDLMFKMFKGLADPRKKADKEELRKKLRSEYATYKKNKKWLDENNKLVDKLSEQIEKKTIGLDSISIINDIIAKDPTILEEINFESSGPVTKKVPLVKLTEELKDLKLDADESDIDQEEKIKEIFKKHKIDVSDVVIGRDNNNEKIAEVELGGLDSLMKFIDTLSLGSKDLIK
jgi:hypothetical protein